MDPAVGGQKTLGLLWRFETLHLPLSSSRRLMRDFSAVVEVSALAMFDTRQNVPLGGGVALQFISDDHPRDAFVTARDAAGSQAQFNVTQAQAEAVIQPDGVLDD